MKTKKAKKEQAIRIFNELFKNDIKEPEYDDVFEGLENWDKRELEFSNYSVTASFEHKIELDKKSLVCIVYFEGEINEYDLEVQKTSFMLVSPSGDTLPDYTKFDL